MAGFWVSRNFAPDQEGTHARLVITAINVETRGNSSPKAPAPLSLRNRIEHSTILARILAAIAGSYLAFCRRTTRWDVAGLADVRAALGQSPVLVVLWHSRSIMGPMHMPVADGPFSSLYAASPIGRVGGALHRRVGLQPIEMSGKQSNRAASRVVLKRVRDGISIAMAADGPLGPARILNDAPLDWARATGVPVFCYAFSTTRRRRLKSWDRMLMPHPFGHGAYIFARFIGDIPRKLDNDQREATRAQLQGFLNATTAQADAMVGVPAGD